jgi:hypothetical protein
VSTAHRLDGPVVHRARIVLWSVVGVVVGGLVGAVLTACTAGFAVWRTATTALPTAIDPVIAVVVSDGVIRAESGDGILLPSLVTAGAGGVLALLLGARLRDSPESGAGSSGPGRRGWGDR